MVSWLTCLSTYLKGEVCEKPLTAPWLQLILTLYSDVFSEQVCGLCTCITELHADMGPLACCHLFRLHRHHLFPRCLPAPSFIQEDTCQSSLQPSWMGLLHITGENSAEITFVIVC